MTVGELRELLVRFDPNMRVVTAGFDEACLDDIETVKVVNVEFDVRRSGGHVGAHEEKPDGVPALLIDF